MVVLALVAGGKAQELRRFGNVHSATDAAKNVVTDLTYSPLAKLSGTEGLRVMLYADKQYTPTHSGSFQATIAEAQRYLKQLEREARAEQNFEARNAGAVRGGRRRSTSERGDINKATADVMVYTPSMTAGGDYDGRIKDIELGAFKSYAAAEAYTKQLAKELRAAANSGGWGGGGKVFHFRVQQQGFHGVDDVYADFDRGIAWLNAHKGGGAPRSSGKPNANRPTAPRQAAAARPKGRAAYAQPNGEAGYYTWLECRAPGMRDNIRTFSFHRTEREAIKAIKDKLDDLMESPGRTPRKGRKIRLLVRDERGVDIAVIPWIAV